MSSTTTPVKPPAPASPPGSACLNKKADDSPLRIPNPRHTPPSTIKRGHKARKFADSPLQIPDPESTPPKTIKKAPGANIFIIYAPPPRDNIFSSLSPDYERKLAQEDVGDSTVFIPLNPSEIIALAPNSNAPAPLMAVRTRFLSLELAAAMATTLPGAVCGCEEVDRTEGMEQHAKEESLPSHRLANDLSANIASNAPESWSLVDHPDEFA